MLARVQSMGVLGIDGYAIQVEVDNRPGTYKLRISGLPDAAIKESEERVISAMRNSGFRTPKGHTVVNLAPADVRKEGSALDLPIAVALLAASEQVAPDLLSRYALVGELALDGTLRPVAGTLSMALAAREQRLEGLIVPLANADEAALAPDVSVIPIAHLRDAAAFLSGETLIGEHSVDLRTARAEATSPAADFAEIKGQQHVKRALLVAAAGGHNLLMIGPPGTGKTMLASRIPGILPEMDFGEALETTRIHSAANGTGAHAGLLLSRPFRAPHHTATTVSIAGGGGGQQPLPGEISLAHNGILFLDELPEFNRAALEVLRQPLEEGLVHIRRARYAVTFPSRFMLVAAMNPCPCGYRGDPRNRCRCSDGEIERYRGRISGPLLDRIDIHVDVPGLSFEELTSQEARGPSTDELASVVHEARARQRSRSEGAPIWNAHLGQSGIRAHCKLGDAEKALLEGALTRLGFSARAYDKILRVARTIADLDASDSLHEQHIAEAIQYRALDRYMA